MIFSNYFLIYIPIFLIISFILAQEMTIKEQKEVFIPKYFFLGLIPYYGYIKIISNKYPLRQILKLAWKYIKYFLVVYLLLIVLVDSFFIDNELRKTILLTFGFVWVLLLHQGIVVEYSRKKGYEGIIPGLIGLIPIYGFAYYVSKKNIRNVSKFTLYETFSPNKILMKMVIYAEMLILGVIVIVPVVYMFGLAFSNIKTAIPNTIWPEKISFESFRYLFKETSFTKWYTTTLLIALINMVGGTVIITGASYIFARFSFKGKKAGLLTILVIQAFPTFMSLVAVLALFTMFNLLGQPLILSIIYIGGSIPGNLWLIKGFLDQIPKDLDESAMIDGASKLRIFTNIILPLSVPILSFVAVNMFMAPWMDYMLPSYVLGNSFAPEGVDIGTYDFTKQWTLAVGLFKFISDPQYMNYSAFAAGALIVGLPIMVLYMVFQKYLIEGIMAGATKG